MTYSCAIFKDLDGDLKQYGAGSRSRSEWSGGQHLKRLNSSANTDPSSPGEDTTETNSYTDVEVDELHEAQLRKLDHIISLARIQPGHRILEIGSGWGSLALRIAQHIPHTQIDTLTLSVHQQSLAQSRILAAGVDAHGVPYSERIRVHLMDYRDMPGEWEGAFDRVVSVEMIEAVGREFLETFWGKVEWAMKRKDAVGVVQVITIPESSEWRVSLLVVALFWFLCVVAFV
jgi:cyclopropane-fatty-acyl-phospholipid synthase